MSEQFKKTYISAREFIISWEKEVYELNNLDYFIFLLINDLASGIERSYFSNYNQNDMLFLPSEETGMLAFNIGDSLQIFIENNCFSVCPLRCPVRFNEKVGVDEQKARRELLSKLDICLKACYSKEQCLYSDILNHVLLDCLLDFYNCEMNVVLGENDKRLFNLAEFIMGIIINFIKNKGQRLLNAPLENAGTRFDNLIKSDESPWEEFLPELEDDEDDETEEWKIKNSSIELIIDEFKDNYKLNFNAASEFRVIDKFKEYLVNLIEIKSVEDLVIEDLEEFFLVVLIHDLIMDDKQKLPDITAIFSQFLTYLEFNCDVSLKDSFDRFINTNIDQIARTLKMTRDYYKKHPLLDFLLSSKKDEEKLVEGFFEIAGKEDGCFIVEDIHLNLQFKPVDLSQLPVNSLKAGDILHVQLLMDDLVWRIANLEMIYPIKAKFYLY